MFVHNWVYNIGFGVVVCTSYLIQHGISWAIWSWRILFVIPFIGISDKEWAACHNHIKPTVYGGPTYVENKKREKFPMVFGYYVCEYSLYKRGEILCLHIKRAHAYLRPSPS